MKEGVKGKSIRDVRLLNTRTSSKGKSISKQSSTAKQREKINETKTKIKGKELVNKR